MARIDVPDGNGLERERLLMMQLDVAMGMGAFAKAVYEKTSLPVRVREIARLRVAAANGCPVCLNTRSPKAEADGLDEDGVQAVITCSNAVAGLFRKFADVKWSVDTTYSGDVQIADLGAFCPLASV